MRKVYSAVIFILISAASISSGALHVYAQNKYLVDLDKKIEKANTPEKREAIAHIRDLYINLGSNADAALLIADNVLKTDRNISVLAKLADYAISLPSNTAGYIALAEQAAKAPLADQEFLQLAESMKQRYASNKVIHSLAKEAARAKTEEKLIPVREKITVLASGQRIVPYDEQEVKPYVAWLENNAKPPADYIFELFKTYDIVFIAERLHPETTQWDFFWELTSDPRFIENIGNIFTEYGSVSQQPDLEKFMSAPLSPEDRDKAIIRLLQNFPIWPIGWTNKNIFDYLGKLHTLNQQLELHKRISLFFSDIPWGWEGKTKKEYEERQKTIMVHRDEIMADRVARKFREIQASGSPRKKALVIMNTRHGFGELYRKGKLYPNACGCLMKQFPGRIANVWMNYIESDNERAAPIGKRLFRKIVSLFSNNSSGESKSRNTVLSVSREEGWISTKKLAKDGIWDAAFGLMGNKPLGFSFRGSPFGEDTFNFIAPLYSMFKYRDVFTGMIFYQPLDRHMIENSLPGYFDPDFQRILRERAKLLGDEYVENVRRIIARAEKIGNNTNKTSTYNFKFVFKPRE